MTELNQMPACSKPLLPAVLSLFDGMSCGQIALNKIGYKYGEYYASEIDKNAIEVTLKNYPKTKQIGSVTEVKAVELPKIELLIGGSPCQSFSNAGLRNGFDGKSKLFYEYVRVLNETKPIYFLLENVKMKKEWQDIISKELGVEPIEICSSLVSMQKRKRVYWTNIPNVTIPNDKQLYLKEPIYENFYKNRPEREYIKKSPTIRSGRQGLTVGIDKRKLNINEVEELQNVPFNYTNHVSNAQRYKMLGNGFTVDIIAHILSFIPQ